MADVNLCKLDDDRQIAFGWASVAFRKSGEQVTDSQDDQIDLAELEGAAYDFVLKSRAANEMHEGAPIGYLVESFMSTPEKLEKLGLAKDALPHALWVGFHVPDKDVWKRVKDGELAMFSIEGTAERVAA